MGNATIRGQLSLTAADLGGSFTGYEAVFTSDFSEVEHNLDFDGDGHASEVFSPSSKIAYVTSQSSFQRGDPMPAGFNVAIPHYGMPETVEDGSIVQILVNPQRNCWSVIP